MYCGFLRKSRPITTNFRNLIEKQGVTRTRAANAATSCKLSLILQQQEDVDETTSAGEELGVERGGFEGAGKSS